MNRFFEPKSVMPARCVSACAALAAFFILYPFAGSMGQVKRFSFENDFIFLGLSQTLNIKNIFVHEKNRIFVATKSKGLFRAEFDGVYCPVINPEETKDYEIAHVSVDESNGHIWVARRKNGFSQLVDLHEPSNKKLVGWGGNTAGMDVKNFFFQDSLLWLCEDKGVLVYTKNSAAKKTDDYLAKTEDFGEAETKPEHLLGIGQDSQKDIWAYSDYGFYSYDKTARKFKSPDIAVHHKISSMAFYKDDICAAGLGYLYFKTAGKWVKHDLVKMGLRDEITSIAFDDNGEIWINAAKRILKYDLYQQKILRSLGEEEGFGTKTGVCIGIDQVRKDVWIGSEGSGLYIIDDSDKEQISEEIIDNTFGKPIVIPNLLFYDTRTLDDSLNITYIDNLKAMASISIVADYLSKNKDFCISLTGHTDINTEKRAELLELSVRRVQKAKADLVEMGVAPNRINIQGVGDAMPITRSKEAEERKANRRIDVLFIEEGCPKAKPAEKEQEILAQARLTFVEKIEGDIKEVQIRYKTGPGDDIASLVQKFQINKYSLVDRNPECFNDDGSLIKGAEILLETQVMRKKTHKIANGETLEIVAEKHGTSPERLQADNPTKTKGGKIATGTVLFLGWFAE